MCDPAGHRRMRSVWFRPAETVSVILLEADPAWWTAICVRNSERWPQIWQPLICWKKKKKKKGGVQAVAWKVKPWLTKPVIRLEETILRRRICKHLVTTATLVMVHHGNVWVPAPRVRPFRLTPVELQRAVVVFLDSSAHVAKSRLFYRALNETWILTKNLEACPLNLLPPIVLRRAGPPQRQRNWA